MQAELGRKSRVLSEEEQESRDHLGTLKQKYEQKIAKLHLHLSEREACERKLKGFIENEIDILHQYNKDESWKTIAGGVGEVCLSPRDLDPHNITVVQQLWKWRAVGAPEL
ncbi:unnamed protein product [Symbiodinium sp. CCMP2592]|nr:unnamed protein product [Symbiodinium sp. CCMP2592]